ncbi:MAG: 5'-nucleotidase C-terminal domain-containing protein [Acidimicrobiaceae bacterium]|nr:5'-nucleotidase C-terminal domain-containing protein [Acidimicrobiaceae bacterium]
MMSVTRQRPAALLLALSLIAALIAALAAPVGAQPVPVPISADTFTLTILHNNDGESKLLPDEDAGFPGVARFVARMKAMQTEAAGTGSGVVTLTSGDNFLASQELNVSLGRDGALYDSIALSGLYDAMALGNHDFDLGPEVTARFIEGFDPAVVFLSANADFSGEPVLQQLVDDGVLAASTVVDVGGQQIGVIGAVTPQLRNISSPRNVVISDVLAAVRAEAERLTAQGVNKIVLVSHLQDVNEEVALVGDLAGVDVVIAGGGDDLLRNEGDSCMPGDEPAGPYPMLVEDSTGTDVPVITAPGGYRCIGALTVVFDGDGNIVSHGGRSSGVGFNVAPDPAVQAAVIEPLAAAVAEIDADVIGASEVDLDGRRAMVRTGSTNQGNLHADALRATAANLGAEFGTPAPDVAIQNGGGIRNDAVIPAGPITAGDTWDIAPFRNFVVVGEVSRETFHVLLEQAVDRIPGAGGQFPQVSGFTFSYDPTAPARETDRAGDCSLAGNPGSRIREVTLDDGTAIVRDGAVVPGGPVVLATIDFLANGGDCYPLAGIEFTKLGVSYQQALANYIAEDLGGRITAAAYPVGGDDRITTAEPEPVTVTVRPGDSLWRLASHHLGSGERWREIFDLNRGRVQADGRTLRDPNLILIGWVLALPALSPYRALHTPLEP